MFISTTGELIMIALTLHSIRKILIPGAFFFSALMAVSFHSMAAEVFISPPGLRLVKDPSVVIPAEFVYPNHRIELPVYRDSSGNPLDGWSVKPVNTRRFASDQSARIFYRASDLKGSVLIKNEGVPGDFRFWPVGTTLVIEIYKGDMQRAKNSQLIEIAAMSKINAGDDDSSVKIFYPVNWAYSRYTPQGRSSMSAAKLRDCHQCHSIAFHYTGDLIFTRFP